MKKLTFLLILSIQFGFSQIITFSDLNFKNALVNTLCIDADNNGIGENDADLDNDGEIQQSEAALVTRLLVFNQNISNLNGIEYFTNLQKLDFSSNNLTSFSLENNTVINSISCSNNPITSLTLNNLPNLANLYCSSNLIQTLDLGTTGFVQGSFSNNPNLQYVNLKNNVINDCIVFPFTGSDYTCAMFLGCPVLQSVCLDSNENNGYFTSPPQPNVVFNSTSNCLMSSESFDDNRITIFPNPVTNELNFLFEKTILINQINIYNTLGQLVKQFNNNQNTINLSDLNSGYYHIEFISEERKLTKKFIKE